jgi:hypothetical protein
MAKKEDVIKEIKELDDDEAMDAFDAYLEEQTDLAYARGYEAATGEDDDTI